MDRKEIEKTVMEKCFLVLGYDLRKLSKEELKLSLLDPRIGFAPRDLLVVFFEIQKFFKIKFKEEDILSRRFDYFDHIVDAIFKEVVNQTV